MIPELTIHLRHSSLDRFSEYQKACLHVMGLHYVYRDMIKSMSIRIAVGSEQLHAFEEMSV
jgi:hypothetical protein